MYKKYKAGIGQRLELLFSAAVVAAHSSAVKGNFRQKDVRFLFELFSNWAHCNPEEEQPVQNTQLVRYLESLKQDGFLKEGEREGRPSYRLTRVGLVELLMRMAGAEIKQYEHFFFLIYFFSAYRERLIRLVEQEGAQYPPSLRLEISALLDLKALVNKELSRAEKALSKLELRVHDAQASSQLAVSKRRQGAALSEITEELERKYPYELNSQKPLSELITSIPVDQRQWEIEEGTLQRASRIWSPGKRLLLTYIAELKRLRQEV